jgi:hypothetical protein
MGVMTKKYTAKATRTKVIRLFRKSPYINWLPRKVNDQREKSGVLARAAISGVKRSLTNEFTTLEKAAPITTPVARSTALPRIKNFQQKQIKEETQQKLN